MSVGLMARPRLRVTSAGEPAVHDRTADAAVLESSPPRAMPWGLPDLRRLVRAIALSGTGLVVAWLVASGTTDLAHQEYAVAGGIVATTVEIAGLAGWLLAGMRSVRELRQEAVDDVRVLLLRRSPASPATAGDLVTAAGMTHYHRASCLMVRGKPAGLVGASALAPCPICRPEDVS